MSYVRAACGTRRRSRETKEIIYESCGMSEKVVGQVLHVWALVEREEG